MMFRYRKKKEYATWLTYNKMTDNGSDFSSFAYDGSMLHNRLHSASPPYHAAMKIHVLFQYDTGQLSGVQRASNNYGARPYF